MKKSRFKQLRRTQKRAAKAKADLAAHVQARGGSDDQVQRAVAAFERFERMAGGRSIIPGGLDQYGRVR